MQKLSPIEINEICEELGETYPKSIEQVHGGDIHNAWRIEFSNKKLFLKRNIRNKKFLKFEKYCRGTGILANRYSNELVLR